MDLLTPRRSSQQYTPATHTEAVHSQRVLLGSSIISDHRRLPDPPWGGSPNLSSAHWRQYPLAVSETGRSAADDDLSSPVIKISMLIHRQSSRRTSCFCKVHVSLPYNATDTPVQTFTKRFLRFRTSSRRMSQQTSDAHISSLNAPTLRAGA